MQEKIIDRLFELQDKEYEAFQRKLIPTIDPNTFIGIRAPQMRAFAKDLVRSDGALAFLDDLPHNYFDENQLHAFILSEMKDFNLCLDLVDRFLPYVDNWATCDQLSPKAFRKHHADLLGPIKKWLSSGKTYSIRFAIGMLLQHFLDEDFDLSYPKAVAEIRSDEYYVNMMRAWYFATALAKQYDNTLHFIENRTLDVWTHNKTIQKAIESYRITSEQKEYLRSLKVKAPAGQHRTLP